MSKRRARLLSLSFAPALIALVGASSGRARAIEPDDGAAPATAEAALAGQSALRPTMAPTTAIPEDSPKAST